MNPEPISDERYIENVTFLMKKGFMPYGQWGQMFFRKGKLKYDLSCADLTKIDAIEQTGTFVITE